MKNNAERDINKSDKKGPEIIPSGVISNKINRIFEDISCACLKNSKFLGFMFILI
tara:strand:+ start:133 stop:297 length:165 start_codon:yes stop_codon:yes gene_type:complete